VNLGWERTSSLLLLDSEGLRRYRDDVFISALTLVFGCQKEHLLCTTQFCLCLTGILLWSCVQTRLGSQRESTVRAPGSNLTPREGRLLHIRVVSVISWMRCGRSLMVEKWQLTCVCVCRWRSSSVFRIISSWLENSLSDSWTTLLTWQSTLSLPHHLISPCSRYVDSLTCDACQSSVYIINVMSCFVSFLTVVFQC